MQETQSELSPLLHRVRACFSLLRRRAHCECVWVAFGRASSFLEDIMPSFLHIRGHGLGVCYNKVFYGDWVCSIFIA